MTRDDFLPVVLVIFASTLVKPFMVKHSTQSTVCKYRRAECANVRIAAFYLKRESCLRARTFHGKQYSLHHLSELEWKFNSLPETQASLASS